MNKNFDKKELFKQYFNSLNGVSFRPEELYAQMEDAFNAGARAMAQDTLDTLLDSGTACAGVEHNTYSLTDFFDEVHANLHTYYTRVLNDE